MNVDALTQEKRAAAAEVIGAFLRALHSLQPGPEVRRLPPREDERMVADVDLGQAFAEEVARWYGDRDLERLVSKLLYFGLVDQIGAILDGKGLALKGQEDEAWLRLKQILRICPSDD